MNPVDLHINCDYLARSMQVWELVTVRCQDILSTMEITETAGGKQSHGSREVAFRWLKQAAARHQTSHHCLDPIRPADRDCTWEIVEYVGAHYPSFLREKISGEHVLLREPGLTLWDRYFSSENFLYAPHNRLAAEALKVCVAGRPNVRVLELGAGSGGGTKDLLHVLQKNTNGLPPILVASDASASLLMRCKRRLTHYTEFCDSVEYRCLNFDRPFCFEQRFDAVVAINALHNATDLIATLYAIQDILLPNGQLIISESLCGSTELVHQDFIFNLLPSKLDHASCLTHSRFGTARAWREVLVVTGYEGQIWRNTSGPELALLAVVKPQQACRP